ncbi:SDR family NAD(P)-dependent oxidoreductase [Alteromonas gilva]|uniref:SDR family NAD(P)-dependent oxidoreductase n=1 Tax=Alteromonas gilva TaxID=2987522 RepID=A0ABT5L786_9ALTE|nr:SDR family NAD(P)-dependent oxidoreductase [Alteromonas gilva]MDC8832284.1 SDR family NAD(P)-dependent oxidoreductase [Alteromonas gilva]
MNLLVIGASGAIGQAVIKQLADTFSDAHIYAVSRSAPEVDGALQARVTPVSIDSQDESAISRWLNECADNSITFHHVVCTTGILHDDMVTPEKRLEDISADALHHYFAVNTVIPALWLKHLVNFFPAAHSTFTLLSARVGSIADNHLGGWYGYRASKAALNMLVKTAAVEYGRRAKHTSLICYHPGTVDSALSAPFQRNVKPEKLFTPAFTAKQLVSIIQQRDVSESPYFLDWDNKPIAW